MQRVGFYTGNVYTEEDYKNNRIRECAQVISDKDASNEDYVNVVKQVLKDRCTGCCGCEEAQKANCKNVPDTCNNHD